MAPTDEAGQVKAIVKAIEERYPNAWVVKIHGGLYQTVGLPDLIVCVQGLLVGLEVKHQRINETREHARARATPGQVYQLDAIRRAGGRAAVVLTPAEALATIESALGEPELG